MVGCQERIIGAFFGCWSEPKVAVYIIHVEGSALKRVRFPKALNWRKNKKPIVLAAFYTKARVDVAISISLFEASRFCPALLSRVDSEFWW